MIKTKTHLMLWTVLLTVFTLWTRVLFGPTVSYWIYLSLTKIGFPLPIVKLILLVLADILVIETVGKFLFLQVPTLKLVATQAESWNDLNQSELTRYTSELEQLGFIKLNDYTITSSPSKTMMRLFAHPQKFCFAEVTQSSNSQISCSISCFLENKWSLSTINISSNSNTSAFLYAFSYAFSRQPRNLIKQFDHASSELLFKSLLKWREQASSDLGLEVIQDVSAETYFERVYSNGVEGRRSLLRKSITWGFLEMSWFSLRPKSEWLGDYSKFKVK
jgi:hypothetical protein